MTESTKTILGVAALIGVAGLGYYLWKQKSATGPTSAHPAAPASGGGTGANASNSSAFNGSLGSVLTGANGLADYINGLGGSIGHLFNGSGGASTAPATTSSDLSPSTDSGSSDNFDYSTLQ